MIKPSLKELINRAKTSMVNATGQDNPAIDALAAAVAGASFGQYAYQDYLYQQINPETADEDWLYIWAERVDQTRIQAQPSKGFINFTDVSGVVEIPKDTLLKTDDDKHFIVTQTTQSDQPVPVQSLSTGIDQNLSAGTSLYLVTAISGLNPNEITSEALSSGSDIEDIEHWRDRIIAKFNQRQAVGTTKDYQLWAKTSHPDIDYAWVIDNTPIIGQVTVYIGQRSTQPQVSDQTKQIAQDFINSVRLAGCHVNVKHPVSKQINISINGVNDQTTRDQIEISLQNFFNEKLGERNDLTPSDIILAITPITQSFGINTPTNIQTLQENELFTLGTITWN